jgi:hypothetical protein
MIGPKKLSTIRQQLQQALTPVGGDPLGWLEERMAAPEHPGSATDGESEVLQSLRRFLEAPGKQPGGKRRASTKK